MVVDPQALVIALLACLGFSLALNVMMIVFILRLGNVINEMRLRRIAERGEFTQRAFEEQIKRLKSDKEGSS